MSATCSPILAGSVKASTHANPFGFVHTGKRLDHFGSGETRMIISLLLPLPGQPPYLDPVLLPQVPSDEADYSRPTS